MSRKKYRDFTGKNCPSYLIDPFNVEMVNFAIKLGKPIVVEGEPGCGKTRLAHAIAEDLSIEGGPKIVPVKSTSRANDLLYRYNALGRLQDSQSKNEAQLLQATKAHSYVELEFLGKAIQQGSPSVILVDEVDKADIDFADDLLHVIENFEFQISEIPEDTPADPDDPFQPLHWIKGPKEAHRPIVIFTSNRSKPLSKPFLRRCFYLELNFPTDKNMLMEIVQANLTKAKNTDLHTSIENISENLIKESVKTFWDIREKAKNNKVSKLPATAELIDWVHVLHLNDIDVAQLGKLDAPYWQLLFKTGEDLELQKQSLS